MKRALPVTGALLLAACDHHVELAGPAGLAYRCADGRIARIFYDRGDPNRAPARLDLGRGSHVLAPAQPMSGLRYEGGGVVWEAEGDDARVTEATQETRCARIRDGDTPPPAPREDH